MYMDKVYRDKAVTVWIPDIWINSVENAVEFSKMRSNGAMA
jgi:hypothetical protein